MNNECRKKKIHVSVVCLVAFDPVCLLLYFGDLFDIFVVIYV